MIYNQENNIGKDEILMLLHKGNEKALAALFAEYHKGLLYFALQYLDDQQAAEDIIAECFMKIWKKRKGFDSLKAIKSFLYTAVKNACLNQLKQYDRHSACHKEIEYISERSEEFFSEKVTKAELLQAIWRDVEQLPPMRRKIFKLFFAEGLSSFEIASVLQISVDTVRVQKARALHALRAIARQKSM